MAWPQWFITVYPEPVQKRQCDMLKTIVMEDFFGVAKFYIKVSLI
jgi:hypothetical protein